tara:strand:+ start:696 stop:896 length:201 start_codon:yes stop_codon:yes gene_type:complete
MNCLFNFFNFVIIDKAKIAEDEHFRYSFISFNRWHGLLDAAFFNGLYFTLLDNTWCFRAITAKEGA